MTRRKPVRLSSRVYIKIYNQDGLGSLEGEEHAGGISSKIGASSSADYQLEKGVAHQG